MIRPIAPPSPPPTFPRTQTFEHTPTRVYAHAHSEYVDYKELKKLIKAARTAKSPEVRADIEAQFAYVLDGQLNKVNRFFERRLEMYSERLQKLATKVEEQHAGEQTSAVVCKPSSCFPSNPFLSPPLG